MRRLLTDISFSRCAVVLFVTSVALNASAASDVYESKSATVATTTENVINVLSSNDICEKGCRYFAPHVVREVKLSHRATENDFYKWTHVSGVKTVKFFKHFRITRGKTTRLVVRALNDKDDAALIAELVKKTGYAHEPAFDASWATYEMTPEGAQVKVQVKAMTRVSGVMSVFAGMVKSEMKKSLDAIFENFTR